MPYVIATDTSPTHYYGGHITGSTTDPTEAIRYATFEEAIEAHLRLARDGVFREFGELVEFDELQYRVKRVDEDGG